MVYIRDARERYIKKIQDWKRKEPRYHLAECETLERMRSQSRFKRYVATTRRDGLFLLNWYRDGELIDEGSEDELKVCKNCLKKLSWEGYDTASWGEKQAIWAAFSCEEYFEEYPSQVHILPEHDEFSAPRNEYNPNWPEVSRKYRESMNWTCEGCSLNLSSKREFLQTHHMDRVRSNDSPTNLQALCLGCHADEAGHERLRFAPNYRQFKALFPG